MKIDIKIPTMGESISEATIGSLIKANGSSVKADDELLELETDKVNQVLYAQQAGTVNWNISPGDIVKVGQIIGSIDDSQLGDIKQEVQKKEDSVTKQETKPQLEKKSQLKEMPLKKSAKKELDLSPSLTPSQSHARSTKDQFLSELNQNQPSQNPEKQNLPASSNPASHEQPVRNEAPKTSIRNETRKPLSKVRKVIAARLVEVLQQTAMLTTFNEVDMTKVIDLRESYKEAFTKRYNARLGFMPFFVKAAVSAMKAFPEINAYLDNEDLVYRNYYDIGIAVGTDKGLFVPVIRNCDNLSFAEIEQSIDSYATKAREGGLVLGDLQGGGFTITNGGTYGSLLSTPILNPPQSAILGIHKIMKRPVVVNDQIVIRQMMYLALSYDHRVVDGKEAVSFLVHIKNALEDPSRLLIGV